MAHDPSSPGVTVLRAGVEDIEPGHWVATVFDLIGCFSRGRTEEEAVAAAPERAREFFAWLARKDGNPAPFEDVVQVAVVERILTRPAADDPAKTVSDIFEDDRRPLRPWDIDMIARLLEWNRQDLLQVLQGAPEETLAKAVSEGPWKTPGDLVAHIYGAEQWLLSRLGLALEREKLPRGRMDRLAAIRARTLEILPGLTEDESVRETDGELWSPRKMIRKILWHEPDHIPQLADFLRKAA
jgi:predicted RNase H-like HicB family nuclease